MSNLKRINIFFCIAILNLLTLIIYAPVFALPTVYPTGMTIYDPLQAYIGYTIFYAGSEDKVFLIDMDDTVVHSWERPDYNLGYAEPLENGNILTFGHTEQSDGIIELDWNSNVVWEFFDSNYKTPHHDFERLENGNTLMLCRQFVNVPLISKEPLYDDVILERVK